VRQTYQIVDQIGKGLVLGMIASWFRDKPEVMMLVVPVSAGLFAWLSTLVGERGVASFLTDK
jgi:uncharacterized membrane protein (Fun14 family)